MKKSLLIIFVITSLQTLTSQNVVYGVKGGLNLSKYSINFNSPLDFNYKIGYQIGGFAKIELADKLYVQPELLYSLQGTKYDINLTDFILPQDSGDPVFNKDFSGEILESTIVLPILLKYYITDNFNIELGPQLDYLFHVKEENTIEVDSNEDVIATDQNRSASDFNFGAVIGVGYDFNKNTGINFRYNYGFNRIESNSSLGTDISNFKLRNSVFQLSFEYRFS